MAKRTLAFEIGTEELPAFDLQKATVQLGKLAEDALKGAGIPFDSVEIFSTPRRLIVMAAGIPEQTDAFEEVFRGPAVRIAFDADGNPTKAAAGFARGKGVAVESLERRMEGDVEYVYAIRKVDAQDVAELLPNILLNLITGIYWPKTQRWGSRNERFSRPVRWLFAMFGSDVISIEFAGLISGNTTCGHRFLAPGPFVVPTADELIDVLRDAYVVPSEAEREAIIRKQTAEIEAKTGLVAELHEKTMAEVINLTEYPTVMVGTFDESFLAVPKEITVDAMLVHQRYFPLFNADGSLANKFLVTSNGDVKYEANIIDGNQRVVAARLYDAKFFWDEDRKQPLESYVAKLDDVVFQESLGTMRAKTDRLVTLAEAFAAEIGLADADAADASRAALLCKADLVTSAVCEFTSVQGIMGRYYAQASKETEQVAQAIADHYRPRFAGDELPESQVGKIVAMADKIDTICGLFAADQAPTGSSDPFALRRSAIGIVAMLESGLRVSLEKAVDLSLKTFKDQGIEFDMDAIKAQVIDFFITRTKVSLKDRGAAVDAIDAVLAVGVAEPATFITRVNALETARKKQPEDFEDLATAYARANNLRDAKEGFDFDQALFTDVEQNLSKAVQEAEKVVNERLAEDDYAAALAELATLRGPIDLFFENTMVMDKDETVRANRMKLLNSFIAVFENVADFGKMAKTK